MSAAAALTDAVWAEHRPAVFGAAYRILGTVTEAEFAGGQDPVFRVAPHLASIHP
jgi:hypothetical protein